MMSTGNAATASRTAAECFAELTKEGYTLATKAFKLRGGWELGIYRNLQGQALYLLTMGKLTSDAGVILSARP